MKIYNLTSISFGIVLILSGCVIVKVNIGSGEKLNRYQDAISSYKEAIRIKPDFGSAYLNLGLAYRKFGRYD